MKKLLSVLICFIMLTAFIPVLSESGNYSLVIMVYMTGSDLESNGGAASADLKEIMESLPDNQGIKVVAMVSGANHWVLDIPYGETSIYEITKAGLSCVQKGSSRSMGDPETLADFLTFSGISYPSEKYGLIVWDHGAGPLVGVCFDETYQTDHYTDRLTMEELDTALSRSPFGSQKLSFIGFDACLMSSLEVAFTVAPYADIMIASQETEPPEGWDYAFLQTLSGNECGDEIGRRIVSSYQESRKGKARPVTLSCLDLGKTDKVCTALASFFSDLEGGVTRSSYPDYTRCRANSKKLGSSTTSQYDLIDLIDLIELYEEENLADGSGLIQAAKDMIICHFSANDDYTNGLSIYYPFDNKTQYETSWFKSYAQLHFVPEYQSFIQKISQLYMGEALLNWKSSYQTQLQEGPGTAKISIDLSEEEKDYLARSRLIVVEKIRNDSFQQIYVDYHDLRHFEGVVSAVYHGEALYQTDDHGGIIAGPITYYPVDDGFAVYGIAYYDFDPLLPYTVPQKMMDAVKLIYHKDQNGDLIFTDIMTVGDKEESGDLFLPSSIDLKQCIGLEIYNAGPESATSLNHKIHIEHPLQVDLSEGAPSLAFLPAYGANARYAYIRLTDLQGNDTCSEVVEIPSPTLISLTADQVCLDNEQCLLTLNSADMVSGYNAGIKCELSVTNRSDEPCKAFISSAGFDAAPVDRYTRNTLLLNPGEKDEIDIFISCDAIQKAGVREAKAMIFELSLQTSDGKTTDYKLTIPVQLDLSIFSAFEE